MVLSILRTLVILVGDLVIVTLAVAGNCPFIFFQVTEVAP